MRHRVRAPLCALAAALLLGVSVTQAGAVALSVSNSSFRVTWTAFAGESGFSTVRCPLTLEGSLHARTLVKAASSLVGFVTRAATGTCEGGTLRLLTETLPWHVQYSSFAGTLPNISAANVSTVGTSFSVRESVFGITCLFRSTAESPATLGLNREAGGSITTGTAGGTIPESGCGLGATARLSGSGTVTLTGSTTRIRLTLIEVALGSLAPNPTTVTLERMRPNDTLELINTDAASSITITGYTINGDFEKQEEERCRRPIAVGRECSIVLTRRTRATTGELTVSYTLREVRRSVVIPVITL